MTVPPVSPPTPSALPVQTWNLARQSRAAALGWLKTAKVELSKNPAAQIGLLNEKVAEVRRLSTQVRDVIFDAKALGIQLRREMHQAADRYEDALLIEMHRVRSEAETKALPKSAEERERYFRRAFPTAYADKMEAERRVEEWDQYEKMLHSIYYSLRDTNNDIQTQLGVIKQQYFSGEIEMHRGAASLADFLGDDVKALLKTPSAIAPEQLPTGLGGIEEVEL